jgi:hypothetical protein
MKKLYSSLVIIACLLAFSLPSFAATTTAVSAETLASIVSGITPNINKIKSSLSLIGQKNIFGKLTATEKDVLIYEETGLKLYLGGTIKNYRPVVKLKIVMDDRVIMEGKPDTLTGTLSLNIGYRWDGYLTLTLDSANQELIIYSADLGEQEVGLENLGIAIGILPHNEGQVKVTGTIVIAGIPINVGTLSEVMELIIGQM